MDASHSIPIGLFHRHVYISSTDLALNLGIFFNFASIRMLWSLSISTSVLYNFLDKNKHRKEQKKKRKDNILITSNRLTCRSFIFRSSVQILVQLVAVVDVRANYRPGELSSIRREWDTVAVHFPLFFFFPFLQQDSYNTKIPFWI